MRTRANRLGRPLRLTLAGLALAVLAAGYADPGMAAVGEYRLIAGTQVAVGTPFDKGIVKLKELVEARTNKRVLIQNYPASQLGNEPELFQGMMQGTVDIAVVAPGQLGEFVPQIALLEMPFVITNVAQRDRVVEGRPMQKLAEIVKQKTGVEIIGVFGGGVRNMFFRKPVKGPEDMKGRRFRVQPSPQLTDSYKALGLEPVVTSYPELYNALQQGVAEGAEMEAIYVEKAGFPVAAPHFLMTRHVITIRPLSMSGKTLAKLPPDLAKIVREAALEAARYERGIESSEDEASLARMAKMKGVTFTEVKVGPMIEAVRPVWEKYAKEWNLMDLLKEIESLR